MKQTKASDVLDKTERNGILALCALNKLENEREIRKRFNVGQVRISFTWKSSKHLMGRFGGGCQWALGFRASGSTILLDCLIFSLMISKGVSNGSK